MVVMIAYNECDSRGYISDAKEWLAEVWGRRQTQKVSMAYLTYLAIYLSSTVHLSTGRSVCAGVYYIKSLTFYNH